MIPTRAAGGPNNLCICVYVCVGMFIDTYICNICSEHRQRGVLELQLLIYIKIIILIQLCLQVIPIHLGQIPLNLFTEIWQMAHSY